MRTKTINLRRGAFGQPSVPFLLSRRAHLLTTPKGRWYCLRQPCALRGGCGFCGSLMDNATPLRCCCHCPRSYRKHTRFCVCELGYKLYPTLRQLPAKICHRQFYRSYGYRSCDTHFLFCEKETKTGTLCFGAHPRKDGEDEWRSTTWKPRWSAEVRDALQLPLLLI